MMQKTIAVADLQKRFSAVFDEVAESHVPYVLIRDQDREPQVALVPYAEYLLLLKLRERDAVARVQRLRRRMDEASADLTDEEVAAEVAAARAELDD